MKIRQGRHNDQILYIQSGDEPSDDDEMLAVFMDPKRAEATMHIMNEHFSQNDGGQ